MERQPNANSSGKIKRSRQMGPPRRLASETRQRLQETLRVAEGYGQQFHEELAKRLELKKKLSAAYASKLQQLEKNIAELQTGIHETQEESKCYRVNNEALRQEIAKVQNENGQLKIRQQERDRLRQNKKEEITQRREALLALKSTAEMKEKMKADMVKFRKLLALEVKKSADNSLMFIFTQVDEKHPTKPFYFKIRVEGEIYEIPACEPPVNDLNKLVDDLNSSNDLQRFVVQVRKRFCQVASETGQKMENGGDS